MWFYMLAVNIIVILRKFYHSVPAVLILSDSLIESAIVNASCLYDEFGCASGAT